MSGDTEDIGGISVSIGASHARLASDLAQAERMLQAFKSEYGTITAQIRAVASAPAAATSAATRQSKAAIVDVQQTAAKPTALAITVPASTLTDLRAVLALFQEIAAAAKQTSALPAPKVAPSAGGRGRRTKAAATGAEDDEDKVPTSIRYVDQVERQRRRAAGAGLNVIDIDKSEQALTRQRQREEAVAARVASSGTATGTRRARIAAAAAESQRLTDEMGPGPGGATSGTFAQAMTERRRAEVDQERQAQAGRQRTIVYSGGQQAQALRSQAREERTLRRALAAASRQDEDSLAQSVPNRDDRIQRRTEERIALQRASITAAGRTARTGFSGISALFGGNQGALIEARARLAAADTKVTEAEKASLPIQRRLASYDEDIANSTDKVRAGLIKKRDAYLSGGRVVAALDNEKKAILGQKDALDELNKLQSGGNIARNLLAITAGGAAFSVGMTVVATVAREVAKGLNEFFEIQTGFGATSTRVTSALGAQTLALHGNADAALAAAEAQAGISAASSDALNSQLKLTTQIKAGAQAQQQASELFRAGSGVGNAPSGLFGSFGGVLGTGLFGQKGFTQQVQTDLAAFQQPRGGVDILKAFSTGLDYLSSPAQRAALAGPAREQGNVALQAVNAGFAVPDAVAKLVSGDVKGALTTVLQSQGVGTPPPGPETAEAVAYVNDLNAAAKRGAPAIHAASQAMITFTDDTDRIAKSVRAAAEAGDVAGVSLAKMGFVITDLTGKVVEGGKAYTEAAQQFAVGRGIADPEQLGKANLFAEQQRQKESAASLDAILARQQFAMPSIIGALGRQQAFTANVQQPAQQYLGALARPGTGAPGGAPIGTGIAAEDRSKVAAGLKEEQGLQDQLNARYEQGRQIVKQTYDPAIFKVGGQAAVDAFHSSLAAVEQTGIKIAQIQASISNEQADYQVAQYNFQLQIAKRSLSDIGGLIGQNLGAGKSELGVLEGQNLALSRQGQQLQFAMSQRQINFQTALAGFQAPGVTPEERQARVKEAQIEAGFAQKQLDIQKQMFGNQVKIVDISNLRQGRDLYKQIFGPGGLVRGRQVTLDIKVKTEALQKANDLQDQNIAKVGTFFAEAEGYIGAANNNITELEAAAGSAFGTMTTGAQAAMVNIASTVLAQFGIFFAGINSYLSAAAGASTAGANYGGGTAGGGRRGSPGGGNSSPATPSTPAAPDDRYAGIDPATGYPYAKTASGGVFNVSGPTRIGGNRIAGEAGDETLLILSNPRSAGSSGTSGDTFIVNFNGTIGVRSEDDINQIARKVQQEMGRTAATKGLRTL